VIREPEFFPSLWYILSRIWYPGHHRVLDAFCLELGYVWLDIGAFVFDHMDTISEESFFPGVLRIVPDIHRLDIATRLDIGSVDLGTRPVIKKISRVL
jgi:hypothetical protein